jgi:hypothetical protein
MLNDENRGMVKSILKQTDSNRRVDNGKPPRIMETNTFINTDHDADEVLNPRP